MNMGVCEGQQERIPKSQPPSITPLCTWSGTIMLYADTNPLLLMEIDSLDLSTKWLLLMLS